MATKYKREVIKKTAKDGSTTKTVFGKGDEFAKKQTKKSADGKTKQKSKMSGETGETTHYKYKDKETHGNVVKKEKHVSNVMPSIKLTKKKVVVKDKSTGARAVRKKKDGKTTTKSNKAWKDMDKSKLETLSPMLMNRYDEDMMHERELIHDAKGQIHKADKAYKKGDKGKKQEMIHDREMIYDAKTDIHKIDVLKHSRKNRRF